MASPYLSSIGNSGGSISHHHANRPRQRPVFGGGSEGGGGYRRVVEGEIPLPLPDPDPDPDGGAGSSGRFAWQQPQQQGASVIIGQKTDPTVSTSFIQAAGVGRGGWFALCAAFLLFLGAVAALVIGILLWRDAELSVGPIGPQGPTGPQGPPGNLTIDLNASNPLPIGNVTLENFENTTVLAINGSLALPLTLWHGDGDNVSVLSSVPNPGPGSDPLLWLETPGGLCFNQTLYGAFVAPDCPDFSAGLQLGQAASFLKPDANNVTLQAADDLYLCTAGGAGTAHLNTNCSPRGPVELGEVQTVLPLDEDACLEWEPSPTGPFGSSGVCHNGTCVQVKEDCLVFDGTAVAFENGAFIDGDLFVSGNLTYTNMLEFNVSEVEGDLTVDGCLFADCVVTNNLTVGNRADYSFGAAWTQAAGGTWTQHSDALFTGNVDLAGPATFDVQSGATVFVQNGGNVFYGSGAEGTYASGAVLTLGSGATQLFETGAAFETESGVTASCASPLFNNASGCLDICDLLPACPLDFDELTVENLTVTNLVCSGTTTGCGGGGGGSGNATTLTDRYVMPSGGTAVTIGSGLVPPVDFSVLGTPATLGSSFDGTWYTLPALDGVYTLTYSLNVTSTHASFSAMAVGLTTDEFSIRLICERSVDFILVANSRGVVCTHTSYFPASMRVRFNPITTGGTLTFDRDGSYTELSYHG